MQKNLALIIFLTISFIVITSESDAQTTILERSVFGAGGSVAVTNGVDTIYGILGQSAIFTLTQSGLDVIHQGFWVPYDELRDVEDNPITLSRELINYPNPFSFNTTIRYTLAASGNATIRIFDMVGRLRKSIILGVQNIGPQEIVWDGKDDEGIDCAAGSYMYELQVNNYQTGITGQKPDLNLRNVMVIVR